MGKDEAGALVPFFPNRQAYIVSSGTVEMFSMPDLDPNQILVAKEVDKILIGSQLLTVISGSTSEGLWCFQSRTLPTVIEARRTVNEEYLLRWPEETLGATPSRLMVENFYAGSYLVFCFPEGTVELFDRSLPVFKSGQFQRSKDKMPIGEMPWPEPFNNDLKQKIIRLVQDCYRALDEALTANAGARLEYLSLRLGYMKNGQLAVSQLVEMVAKHGEEAIALSRWPSKLACILDPPGA